MARRERDKGRKGEREVLDAFVRHGFHVRGLESGGDHLAIGHGLTLHVESKRQETARPWQWYEQAVADAAPSTPPVVAFRRSRSPWLAMIELEQFLTAIEVARSDGFAEGQASRS